MFEECAYCGTTLDPFGQCYACDTYGTPAEQRQEAAEAKLKTYEIQTLGLTAQYEARDMDLAVAQVLHGANEVRYSEGDDEGWFEFWTANASTSLYGFIRELPA